MSVQAHARTLRGAERPHLHPDTMPPAPATQAPHAVPRPHADAVIDAVA